jgi:hypothetical protein
MSLLNWLLVIGAGLAGLTLLCLALDRLGVWAESKGWIYWRKRRSGSAFGGVMSAFDVVGNPGVEHIIAAKDAKKLEEKDSGDGDKPGIIG